MITISCCSQIVDINTSSVRMTQGGYYKKDSNNDFIPYIGNWEAIWDNKKITFIYQKLHTIMCLM